MMKKIAFILALLTVPFFAIGQEATLCSTQTLEIFIEDLNNVPSVTSNDDGTVTITHPEQYITDIFADYILYDFYQTYPDSGSETLQKFYTMGFKSKNLIVDMLTNIPSEIFEFSDEGFGILQIPLNNPINPDIIDALDDKIFSLVSTMSSSDGDGCNGDCPFIDVPDDFEIDLSFDYDQDNNILYLQTVNDTPCGNSFSIGLKGGNPTGLTDTENSLQLWESTPTSSPISDFSNPCYTIENTLNNILDIGCSPYYNIGNILFNLNTVENQISFTRENAIFGTDTVRFAEADLSLNNFGLDEIFPFQKKGNPYLQLANSEDNIYVEISNLSGQIVLNKERFQENTLDISNLSNGLYFLKISNLSNKQNIHKFLKN